jgi:hypothetical protein
MLTVRPPVIYIGKATSLLDPQSDESMLVHRCKNAWNKPAAFTWNSSTGLEMHYRIQPPADWIVSSSEDESLNGIDLDLSELDDVDEFTVNTDMLKCVSCGTLWDTLDQDGLCQQCQTLLNHGYVDPRWLSTVSVDVSLPLHGTYSKERTTPSDLSSSMNCSAGYHTVSPHAMLSSGYPENLTEFDAPELFQMPTYSSHEPLLGTMSLAPQTAPDLRALPVAAETPPPSAPQRYSEDATDHEYSSNRSLRSSILAMLLSR